MGHGPYDKILGCLRVGSLVSALRDGKEVSDFQALTRSRPKAEIFGRVSCELALNLSNVLHCHFVAEQRCVYVLSLSCWIA
jgi:hypothetical protein